MLVALLFFWQNYAKIIQFNQFSGQVSPREKGANRLHRPLLKHQPVKYTEVNTE